VSTGADDIVLIGGGGHAIVVAEAARRDGIGLAGLLDDDERCPQADGTNAVKRIGALRAFDVLAGRPVHLAVGGIPLRRELIDLIEARGLEARSIIDPASTVMVSAARERGVFVAAGAIVQSRAAIGAWCIINTGAIIEHECMLEPNVHVAPGAVLAGRVFVGADTLIGVGARVLPGVSIGRGCVVGAGAVVTEDVADGARVVGVPARVLV